MKTYKARIGFIAISLLLIAGCSNDQQKAADASGEKKVNDSFVEEPLVIETTGDFIVDINDGKNDFEAFRMLNESKDLGKAEAEAFEEIWTILDNAKWETSQVSMSRSADYRIEVVDKRNKEKTVTTFYYLWANPEYKSIELVDYDNEHYVLMKQPDSEKLYKFLTNKNLSEHVVVE